MSVSDSLRKADGKFDRNENDVVYLPFQMAALLSTHTAFVSLDVYSELNFRQAHPY
jgi:hypothetical protein